MKTIATGRKNWLFTGSENGGKTMAVLFSVVSSCQRHGHDPFVYLRDVLERLPSLPHDRLAELLPDRWSPPKPAERLARGCAGNVSRPWSEASTSEVNPWPWWRSFHRVARATVVSGRWATPMRSDHLAPVRSRTTAPCSTLSVGKARGVRRCQPGGRSRPKSIVIGQALSGFSKARWKRGFHPRSGGVFGQRGPTPSTQRRAEREHSSADPDPRRFQCGAPPARLGCSMLKYGKSVGLSVPPVHPSFNSVFR